MRKIKVSGEWGTTSVLVKDNVYTVYGDGFYAKDDVVVGVLKGRKYSNRETLADAVGGLLAECDARSGTMRTAKREPRSMPKAQLRKLLQPGVWVRIWWSDAPDTIELLIHKPDWSEAGDVSLSLFDGKTYDDHAVHTQVVAVLGRVQAPRMTN